MINSSSQPTLSLSPEDNQKTVGNHRLRFQTQSSLWGDDVEEPLTQKRFSPSIQRIQRQSADRSPGTQQADHVVRPSQRERDRTRDR